MKKLFISAAGLLLCAAGFAKDVKVIQLPPPDTTAGAPIMQALAERRSVREFSAKELNQQMLSNLLWAANGVNRPAENKRTAPSAMNRQEIDIYACMKDGAYLYNASKHILQQVSLDDCRYLNAPVTLMLVANVPPGGNDWAGLDAGIVSQNISLFCSGMGLATVPRGQMDKNKVRTALRLAEQGHILLLNHPVGYPKETAPVKKEKTSKK